MRGKMFTHEFKQECVNLVIQHNYPVTQAAEIMNIGLSTLHRCVTAISWGTPRKYTNSQCYNTGTTADIEI
ncbi:transposase [Yersinia canariae]|nr:transposase [Yersinia canariae]